MLNFRVLRNIFSPFKTKGTEAPHPDSETKFENIVEHSIVGVCIIQEDYIRYVNKKICEIFGFTYEEIVDKLELSSLFYEPDKNIVKENISKQISGESQSIEYELRGIRKDGHILWIRVLGNVIQYQGKPAMSVTMIDFTDHKQVEDALFKSEERLRVALETTGIGIWDWDVEKDVWYASPIYYTMLGYEPINGPSDRAIWLTRIHPEDIERVKTKIKDVLAHKADNYIYEARMLHADGSYCWHQVIGYVVARDTQRKVTRLVGIRKDISEFKKVEEGLRTSESHMRTLIDTLPDLVWLKDPEGVYLQCNHRFEQLYGALESGIIGKTDYHFVHKELADFFSQKDIEAAQAGKPTINEEEVTFADKHKEILETIKTPIFRKDGTFLGVLGIGRDITQRKHIEQTLWENQRFLTTLISNLPGMVYRCKNDPEWTMEFVSEGSLPLTGYHPEELMHSETISFGELIHEADQNKVWNAVQEMLTLKRPYFLEYRIRQVNGNMKWVWEQGRGIFSESGDLIFLEGFITDITERKQAEQELEKYREHLEFMVKERTEELDASLEELHVTNEDLFNQKEELQIALDSLNDTKKQLIQSEKMASLGILSAGIAHEINNPLNFIHGGITCIEDYLKDHCQEDIESMMPFTNAVKEGLNRATNIVSSLKHYSRNDELPMTEFDLHTVIDHCLTMLQNQLKGKVEVVRQYTEKQIMILGNESKLHQAILNVIANAEQAIEKSGKIIIETKTDNKQVIITITDSGVGIKEESIGKIFDPFYTTKAPGKGTGLGLSITYNIIEEHRGTIAYESEPGKGTKAMIRLPISK